MSQLDAVVHAKRQFEKASFGQSLSETRGFEPVHCISSGSISLSLAEVLSHLKKIPCGGHWIPAEDSKPSVREEYKGGKLLLFPRYRRPTVPIFPSYILAPSSLKERSSCRSEMIYSMLKFNEMRDGFRGLKSIFQWKSGQMEWMESHLQDPGSQFFIWAFCPALWADKNGYFQQLQNQTENHNQNKIFMSRKTVISNNYKIRRARLKSASPIIRLAEQSLQFLFFETTIQLDYHCGDRLFWSSCVFLW